MNKTNVMRLLIQQGITPVEKTYDEEIVDGMGVAAALGEDPECVFKSLVTETDKKEHFIFEVPVNATLDLKKAAKAVGAKSLAMIPQKELFPLTGYVHGGCSPIGLKKAIPCVLDETATLFERIYISGGKRGYQVGITPAELIKVTGAKVADIVKY